jgi:hypothetical protein
MKYKYGTNYAVLIAPVIAMILVPFSMGKIHVFTHLWYWAVVVAWPVLGFLWYSSKYLKVDPARIVTGVLWGVELREVAMASVLEISELRPARPLTGMQGTMRPFAVIDWFAGRYLAPSLKLIVDNEEAFYLNLKYLPKSAEVYELLEKELKSKWRRESYGGTGSSQW